MAARAAPLQDWRGCASCSSSAWWRRCSTRRGSPASSARGSPRRSRASRLRADPRRRRLHRRHRRDRSTSSPRADPRVRVAAPLAQLRPPDGDHRRPRARARRRGRDARRRPAGPAGADPRAARRAGARAPTSSYAVRAAREGETRFKLATARWFYAIFGRLAQIELEPDAGDFRLIDRAPLDALLRMPERNRFLRGMTVWVGFQRRPPSTYDRAARTRRRDEVPARAGCCASRSTRSRRSRTSRCSSATLARLRLRGVAFLRAPADDRRPLRGHLRARRAVDCSFVVLLLGGIQLITLGHHRRVRRAHLRRGQAAAALRRRARAQRRPRPGRRSRRRAPRALMRIAVLGAGVAGLDVPRTGSRRPATPSTSTSAGPASAGRRRRSTSAAATCSSATTTTCSRTDRHIAALYDELGHAGRARVAAVVGRVLRSRARSWPFVTPAATCCASRRCRCASRLRMGLGGAARSSAAAATCAPFERMTARDWIVRRDGRRGLRARSGARCCAASSATAPTTSRWPGCGASCALRRSCRARTSRQELLGYPRALVGAAVRRAAGARSRPAAAAC